MPINDKIEKYSVSTFRRSLLVNGQNTTRQIRLALESGGTASISFGEPLPAEFLQFFGSATSLFMTTDQFEDVHRTLQSESPVFFTALNLLGIRIGSVHTELLSAAGAGETPGEGPADPNSLEAMIARAREAGSDRL